MKKEYTNPQIHVVKMQTMTVLAESTGSFGKGTKPTSEACSTDFFETSGSDGEEW